MIIVFALLRKLIKEQVVEILEEENKEVLIDTENDDSEEDVKTEFSSAGGTGAVGQFGYAVPLGGRSNAKTVEKNKKK